MAFLEEFQHLKIQLEDIKSATANFDNSKVIGRGGFGKVYEGVVSHSKGQSIVACKRLDVNNFGQGYLEFLKEILLLSSYTHQNLISLLGFCDEKDEKILVYEHATHGSLDRHLSDTTLTWRRRLKICLGAARGLCHLHDPKETQQRVLHRDIKSSNILLDGNWNAKVSDIGLSKLGPANQSHTFLATNLVGTPGYIDPVYMDTCSLTKESDVYSFGVVLFEVACGRLCFEVDDNRQLKILVSTWKQSYEEKKLDEIIFVDLKQHMNSSSVNVFLDIAYRCLHGSRKERPNMSLVVEELEKALKFQDMEQPTDYEEMSSTIDYLSKEALSKGIMVNGGKTWLWSNRNGKHCEMISAAECLIPTINSASFWDWQDYDVRKKSRFSLDYPIKLFRKFKTRVKPQFLSPHVTYSVSLVFVLYFPEVELVLDYTLAGEKESTRSNVLDKREDGWFTTELYQLTSDTTSVDLEIMFECNLLMAVEGVEFLAVDREEHHKEEEEEEEVDMQTDTFWEQKLPSDYQDIINRSEDGVQWTSKKELYFILCKGFPINNGDEWFSLDKNGKKCHMQAANVTLFKRQWRWQSSPDSRFKQVAVSPYGGFYITCSSKMLSPQTTYGCYLVYKLQNIRENFGHRVEVDNRLYRQSPEKFHIPCIQLTLSKTPIIRRKVKDNTPNPLKRTKMKGIPRLRNDGWMEVQVWESQTGTTTGEKTSLDLKFQTKFQGRSFIGLIVQGVEFKPI